MLNITMEQGQQLFLKALTGNNFSKESIRAYSADLTQSLEFLASIRDWNTPQKITRIDIVEFMNWFSGMKRTGTTRARKLASIRHFLKFLKPYFPLNLSGWTTWKVGFKPTSTTFVRLSTLRGAL
jgi:site-specific recombinase XerD